MIKKLKAFTLLELSLVLIIISLLIASSLSVSKRSLRNNGQQVTKDKLEKIYQAVGLYLKNHDRIPCPAAINLSKSDSDYGRERHCKNTPAASSGIYKSSNADYSNLVFGMVPTQTLGLSSDMAEDGFGSKIEYIMIDGFANQFEFDSLDSDKTLANSSQSSTWDAGDGEADLNRIRIHERINSQVNRITSEAIIVLISHGQNRLCAFGGDSTTQNATSSDGDESFNCASSFNNSTSKANFYDYDYSSNQFPIMANSTNDSFDDIVLYKSKKNLMVDFDYYKTPSCSEDFIWASATGGNPITYVWEGNPDLEEGKDVVSATPCPTGYSADSGTYSGPVIKCGDLRRWKYGEIEVFCLAD